MVHRRDAASSSGSIRKPSPTPSSRVQTRARSNSKAGRLDTEVYRLQLPSWRFHIRELLVQSLAREMSFLVWIQRRLRCRTLDRYFVWTSLLGTLTFFMIGIPMLFFFGQGHNSRSYVPSLPLVVLEDLADEIGDSLLYILATGGYLTSILKDLFCVPRPFSPPLVRLTVGTHGTEYAFPSTHSTNAVGMAFYFGELLLRETEGRRGERWIALVVVVGLAGSIVFGRLYTGMVRPSLVPTEGADQGISQHSIMDVSIGSLIGYTVYAIHHHYQPAIERFTCSPTHLPTLIILPLALFLCFYHPRSSPSSLLFQTDRFERTHRGLSLFW